MKFVFKIIKFKIGHDKVKGLQVPRCVAIVTHGLLDTEWTDSWVGIRVGMDIKDNIVYLPVSELDKENMEKLIGELRPHLQQEVVDGCNNKDFWFEK